MTRGHEDNRLHRLHDESGLHYNRRLGELLLIVVQSVTAVKLKRLQLGLVSTDDSVAWVMMRAMERSTSHFT